MALSAKPSICPILNRRNIHEEVYDQLGVSRTPEGSVCGWIANSENGDGYVDFGNPESCAWRYYDGVRKHDVTECVLDFNIDGVIWDQI